MTIAIAGTAAILLCAVGIFRARKIVGHHHGHHALARSQDMDDAPTGPMPELNDTASYDVPVYPVERPAEPATTVDEFYEEDEPIEKVESVYERADRVLTTPPDGWTGPVHEPPHALESYCRRHPTEPCTCPDEAWMNLTGEDTVVDLPAVSIDDLVAEVPLDQRDPATLTWIGDDEPEVGPDPDPDATGEWPTANHLLVYGDELLDEISAEEWLQPLQNGTNGRAVRRLKSMMQDRGWTSRGQREKTPRSTGKRRRRHTLKERLDVKETRRERKRERVRSDAAAASNPGGRHRRTTDDAGNGGRGTDPGGPVSG